MEDFYSSAILEKMFSGLNDKEIIGVIGSYIEAGKEFNDDSEQEEIQTSDIIGKIMDKCSKMLHTDSIIVSFDTYLKMMVDAYKMDEMSIDSNILFKYVGCIAGMGVYVYRNQEVNQITVVRTEKDLSKSRSMTFQIIL